MKLKRLEQILLALIVLTGCLNLFYKFPHSQAYVQGWLVDYLIPKFYLSDIFIIILIIVVLITNFSKIKAFFSQQKKTNWSLWITLFILLVGILLRQFTTSVPIAALYYFAKLFEFVLLAFALYLIRDIFTAKYLYYLFSMILILESLLGLYQFIAQKPLFPYHILGETNLASSLGLPRFSLFGGPEKVMPYGTFPHPNILAGLSVLSFLIILQTRQSSTQKRLDQLTFFLATFLLLIILFLTQSLAALLTLILGLFIFTFQKQLINSFPPFKLFLFILILYCLVPVLLNFSALSPQIHHLSITRRADLQLASLKLFTTFPLEGAGLNQFIVHLPTTHPQGAAQINFHQPVHNIFLLWLSETGLLGLASLALLIYLLHQKLRTRPHHQFTKHFLLLLVILPITTLDHYFLTTQSGLLFFVIIWLIFPHTYRDATPTKTAQTSLLKAQE